jgi:hypothetical protein
MSVLMSNASIDQTGDQVSANDRGKSNKSLLAL